MTGAHRGSPRARFLMHHVSRILCFLSLLTLTPNALASQPFRADPIDRAEQDRTELESKILQSTREIEIISIQRDILAVRYNVLYKVKHGPHETIEDYFQCIEDLIIRSKAVIALAEEDKRCGDEKLPGLQDPFREFQFEPTDSTVFEAQLHYAIGVEKLTGRNGIHGNLEEMRSKLAELEALIDESEVSKPHTP